MIATTNLTPSRTRESIWLVTEALLVGMSGLPGHFDLRQCRRLPPWRAVMLARIAYKADLCSREDLDAMVTEARLVGGNGTLKNITDHTGALHLVKCPAGHNYQEHTGPCTAICDYPDLTKET